MKKILFSLITLLFFNSYANAEIFKNRGITVYGNIEPKIGEKELHKYVKDGKTVYKPTRDSE